MSWSLVQDAAEKWDPIGVFHGEWDPGNWDGVPRPVSSPPTRPTIYTTAFLG